MTPLAPDLENAFVVGTHGDSQFVVEHGKGNGFQFLASHVFALKGTLSGTVRRICGDGVDDETVDVRDHGGGDIRRRQVLGSLECQNFPPSGVSRMVFGI